MVELAVSPDADGGKGKMAATRTGRFPALLLGAIIVLPLGPRLLGPAKAMAHCPKDDKHDSVLVIDDTGFFPIKGKPRVYTRGNHQVNWDHCYTKQHFFIWGKYGYWQEIGKYKCAAWVLGHNAVNGGQEYECSVEWHVPKKVKLAFEFRPYGVANHVPIWVYEGDWDEDRMFDGEPYSPNCWKYRDTSPHWLIVSCYPPNGS